MSLKSALEDLSRTTLKAISGCLQRLEYIAGLRANNDYAHWGFGKVYGQANANKALEIAHRDAVSQVLSTPLATLLKDVEDSNTQAGIDPQGYLEKLSQNGKDLLPVNPGAGSARHLSSVLSALSGLEKSVTRNATDPAASPHRSLARPPQLETASEPGAQPATRDATEE